jgi:hypothetical protein
VETFYGWNVCVRRTGARWMWQQALELLQPAHWMNFHWAPEDLQAPGYVPIIWGKHAMLPEYRDSVVKALRAYPDNTWLMINEGHLQEQANLTPAEGVDLALWWINLADKIGVNMNWCGPNCAINMDAQHIGGLSGVAWWREFLKLLRKKGLVAPSAHGIHMYNTTSLHMFQAIWSYLREWRWQFIGKDGPIIITELCAENQPLEQQIEVMDEAFRLLEIGLREGPSGQNGIMGSFWFVAGQRADGMGGAWPNCALTEIDPGKRETMRLTPLGQHWKALQARL